MAESWDEKWKQFGEALAKAICAWRETILPAIETARDFCEGFHEVVWEAYCKAGMCYGESDDGMWRWLRECAEAQRLRQRAEEIELYHRQMAAFRVMVVGKEGGGEEGGMVGGGEG